MSFPRSGRASIPAALQTIVCAVALAFCGAAAQAQSLTEVIDAARGYDANYLGTRSNADAVRYRYEQSLALHRPNTSARLVPGPSTTTCARRTAPKFGDPISTKSDIGTANLVASQSIYNRQNELQIDEAQKAIDVTRNYPNSAGRTGP